MYTTETNMSPILSVTVTTLHHIKVIVKQETTNGDCHHKHILSGSDIELSSKPNR